MAESHSTQEPKREWPVSWTNMADFAPGVTRHEDIPHDVYIGSSDAVIAAGLVLPDQLPGTPYTGKVQTTFFPDGTRVKKGGSCNTAGSKTVKKLGDRIAVEVRVEDTIREERLAAWINLRDEADAQYDRAVAERRAAHARANAATQTKGRGHLRLVWSA